MSGPARTTDLILPSANLVDRPAPETVPAGSLFPSIDTQIIYRNNDDGTAWEDWLVVADFSPGTNAEEVRDIIAAMLKAGTGVTLNNNDGTNELTVSVATDAEVVRDTVAAALVAGTGITITPNDGADTITLSASGGDANAIADNVLDRITFAPGGGLIGIREISGSPELGIGLDAEVVRDIVGSILVAGSNVTLTVDDAANTVTIAATGGGGGGGLDAEGVRDTIGATLVAGSNVTITPNDGADTITIAASGGGGGGSTTLDGLTDVTTPTPGDGYVLTYDSATSQWVARPGGGAVGAWENDQLATFTPGTLSEVTGSPMFTVAGTTYPGSPQHTLTVTSGMLASCDKAVGFSQYLEVVFYLDASAMTGATSGTLFVEATRGGDVLVNSVNISTTTTSKIAMVFVLRDAVVGDVITFKFRLGNAGHGGVTCLARGAACYPSQIFSANPAGGGRYLYRDFVTGAMAAAPLVASQGGTANLQPWRYWDDNVVLATSSSSLLEALSAQRQWLSGSLGIMGTTLWSTSTPLATASQAGNPLVIPHMRAPLTVRYDRLAIPVPPA